MNNGLRLVLCLSCYLLSSWAPDIALCENYLKADPKLVRGVSSGLSPATGLPFSFHLEAYHKKDLFKKWGRSDSLTSLIERLILEEGLSIYDAALWQITLTMLGGKNNLRAASLPVEIYWEGTLGELTSIRAGYNGQPFVYDPREQDLVPADLSRKGQRGFLFRIINANGRFTMSDPGNGLEYFEHFPNFSRIHWEDWKPIAGENAWVAMAALQLYHKKYFDPLSNTYDTASPSVELNLSEELARAAIILQSDCGGIRMAPLGTYYHLLDINDTGSPEEITSRLDEQARIVQASQLKKKTRTRQMGKIEFPEHDIWYYEEISTENNLSWYAAFRMLYKITEKPRYKEAMEKIEAYLIKTWSPDKHFFYQGMHFYNDEWLTNTRFFATDVQNWALIVLGPQKIDEWFGEGSAMAIWKNTKERSGCYNDDNELQGMGFTQEQDQISVEWTAGAILAARALERYYAPAHPSWAEEAVKDIRSMRRGVEPYRRDISSDTAAYAYSSKRGWIPFGWFSHDPEVLSLVSTCWIILVDSDFNPFVLSGK